MSSRFPQVLHVTLSKSRYLRSSVLWRSLEFSEVLEGFLLPSMVLRSSHVFSRSERASQGLQDSHTHAGSLRFAKVVEVR